MEPGEVFPSLTVDINSPTPYTDATQVRDTMMHTTTRETTLMSGAIPLMMSGTSHCSRQ